MDLTQREALTKTTKGLTEHYAPLVTATLFSNHPRRTTDGHRDFLRERREGGGFPPPPPPHTKTHRRVNVLLLRTNEPSHLVDGAACKDRTVGRRPPVVSTVLPPNASSRRIAGATPAAAAKGAARGAPSAAAGGRSRLRTHVPRRSFGRRAPVAEAVHVPSLPRTAPVSRRFGAADAHEHERVRRETDDHEVAVVWEAHEEFLADDMRAASRTLLVGPQKYSEAALSKTTHTPPPHSPDGRMRRSPSCSMRRSRSCRALAAVLGARRLQRRLDAARRAGPALQSALRTERGAGRDEPHLLHAL